MKHSFSTPFIAVLVLGLGMGAAFAAGTAYGHSNTPQAAAAGSGSFQQGGSSFGSAATNGGNGRPILIGTVSSLSNGTFVVAPLQISGRQGTGQQPGSGQASGQSSGQGSGQQRGNGGQGSTARQGGGQGNATQQSGAGQTGPTKVTTADTTTLEKNVAGSIADLKEGDRVAISGERSSDGSVKATSIQVLAAGQSTQ